MKDELLTTKQFADLCRVEKRTLFYYDEINLLKPVLVTRNNYRYYSPEQFDTMSMIKALQSVGMSLNEIKALMGEKDLPRCVDILKEQIPRMKEKQEELRQAEQFLSHTVEELEHCHGIGCDKFYIEQLQETGLHVEPVSGQGDSIFINYLTNGYHHGVIIKDFISARPESIFQKVSGRRGANAVRPAGAYACMYRGIPNGKINRAIHGFLDLLGEKRIVPEGPLYLEDIASDFVRLPGQELLFKFSIKISDNPGRNVAD